MNRAFCGLNLDIEGCFFCIESVLYDGPPGGGIDTVFSLFPNGALEGELDVC